MEKEDIKIGAWVIWDGDTYPHPRLILRKRGDAWVLNIKKNSTALYKEYEHLIYEYSFKVARLCREDEIPLEYRVEPSYEIY